MRYQTEPPLVIVALADDPTHESIICIALEHAGYLPVAVDGDEEARILSEVAQRGPVAIVTHRGPQGATHLASAMPGTALVFCPEEPRAPVDGPPSLRALPDLVKVLDDVSRADRLRQRRH